MEILYFFGIIGIIYYLWLSILATFAIRYDRTLNTFQKNSQTIFLWLVPIFGGALVLHLIWEHYPEAIPKSWIPWPFKMIVFGKSSPNNKNRDEDQGPGVDGSNRGNNHSKSDFDGDVGGD